MFNGVEYGQHNNQTWESVTSHNCERVGRASSSGAALLLLLDDAEARPSEVSGGRRPTATTDLDNANPATSKGG